MASSKSLLTVVVSVAFVVAVAAGAGWLTLRDNPAANSLQEVETPTTVPPGELETVYVFLAPEAHGGNETERELYTPVARFVPKAHSAAERVRNVLLELLRGATVEEKEQGASSVFSEETAGMLNGVTLEDGHLEVDFKDLREVIPQAGTSTGGAVFQTQLNSTTFALPAVKSVVYEINGNCAIFAEWQQEGPCHLKTREWWEQGSCGLPFGFRPTYLPPGFEAEAKRGNSDGELDVPRPGIAHYPGSRGSIDIEPGPPGFAQSFRRRITVLGRPAFVGDIHEGYSVNFSHESCDYELRAYGISRPELRRFAEGLREKP